jgi:ribosomal protein S17E
MLNIGLTILAKSRFKQKFSSNLKHYLNLKDWTRKPTRYRYAGYMSTVGKTSRRDWSLKR